MAAVDQRTTFTSLGFDLDSLRADCSERAGRRLEGLGGAISLETDGDMGIYTYPLLDGTVEGKAGRAIAEPCINLGSAATALLDAPDDERLATTAVTSGKHALDARRVFL